MRSVFHDCFGNSIAALQLNESQMPYQTYRTEQSPLLLPKCFITMEEIAINLCRSNTSEFFLRERLNLLSSFCSKIFLGNFLTRNLNFATLPTYPIHFKVSLHLKWIWPTGMLATTIPRDFVVLMSLMAI